jgi:DNA-binding transcriptional MerR regulator
MLIGELMKRSGLTKDAIRFYERRGLISLDKRERRHNNYKEYSEQLLERLLLIKTIKEFGFTINEIDELFESWEGDEDFCKVVDPYEKKITQIDAQIKRLQSLRLKLTSSMKKCEGGGCEFRESFPSHLRNRNSSN